MNPFDQKAAQWDEDPNRVKLAHGIANAINQALPLNKTVTAMELGCGTGLVSLFLCDKLKTITAADNSQGMLDRLQEKIKKENITNITPLLIDLAGSMAFPEKFDLVFSSMTFHHIKDYRLLLKKIYETLKPGGVVAVADLEAEDGTFHPADVEIAHKGFEKNDFAESLRKAGFIDVKCVTAFVIPGAARGSKRDYCVFLATGKK
jgi:ubiquinone/menaquinone biosynthesis C-methylase UbiE